MAAMQVLLTAITQMETTIIIILTPGGVSGAMTLLTLPNTAKTMFKKIFSKRGHPGCSGVKVTL